MSPFQASSLALAVAGMCGVWVQHARSRAGSPPLSDHSESQTSGGREWYHSMEPNKTEPKEKSLAVLNGECRTYYLSSMYLSHSCMAQKGGESQPLRTPARYPGRFNTKVALTKQGGSTSYVNLLAQTTYLYVLTHFQNHNYLGTLLYFTRPVRTHDHNSFTGLPKAKVVPARILPPLVRHEAPFSFARLQPSVVAP